MNILYLGPENLLVLNHLKKHEKSVIQVEDVIDEAFLKEHSFDFLISYGYRHILKKSILDYFPKRAINLHISYLPWNRGADPNFWSFIEKTPKGVTIHYLDEGVDTGDILVQKEIALSADETLRTSYETLQRELQQLFFEHWESIRSGTCPQRKQEGKGTCHRQKDKEPYLYLLTDGWDTPVRDLRLLL